MAKSLLELEAFINEVLLFINKFADKKYFCKAFDRSTDASTFEEYSQRLSNFDSQRLSRFDSQRLSHFDNQRLSHFVESLRLGISVDAQVLRRENEEACKKDFESTKTMIVTMIKA